MNTLPQQLPLSQMQTKWAAILNPVLSNPLSNGRLISAVTLTIGDNTINHGLGRKLQGWIITSVNAAATIYDKQTTNNMPELTLVLNSNADAAVSLWVF